MSERRHGSSPVRWRIVGRRVTDFPAHVGRWLDRIFGQSALGAHLRNFWLLLITGLVLVALHGQSVYLAQVAKSRHFVIAVSCAVESGTSEAGRHVISGGARAPETPFDRALEKLGYPPQPKRVEAADRASALYVAGIAQRVLDVAGKRAKGLVNKDGTINCKRLQQIANRIASR